MTLARQEARTWGCYLWILSLFARKQIWVKLSLAFASWALNSPPSLCRLLTCLFLVTIFSFSKFCRHSLSVLLIWALSRILSQLIQRFQLYAAYLYCELTSTGCAHSPEPMIITRSIQGAPCLLQSPSISIIASSLHRWFHRGHQVPGRGPGSESLLLPRYHTVLQVLNKCSSAPDGLVFVHPLVY